MKNIKKIAKEILSLKGYNYGPLKIMGDDTLLIIALKCPKKIDELSSISGMTQSQVRRHGESILRLVRAGLRAKPIYPEHPPRPSEPYLSRVDQLRSWRKRTAAKMGVQSDVILPRNIMHRLAQNNPQCSEDLASLLKDVPWRMEHFGLQILEAMTKPRYS